MEQIGSETAPGTSADHVEHHDGSGPRPPTLPRPVAVGLGAFCVFTTWNRGRVIVSDVREHEAGALRGFIDALHAGRPPVRRVPGTAVFLNANPRTTPWALRTNLKYNHSLHEQC